MAADDIEKITTAANSVIQALAALSLEERSRVLESAAALYGLSIPKAHTRNEGTPEGRRNSDQDGPGESRSNSNSAGKRQSIVEFLKDKAPATNDQRIACFAFYREHVEGKGTKFSRADLEPYFASAKLASPGKNYPRDYTKAVREGWIHDDGADSYLTQGGEDAVRAGFGGKARPRGAQVPQRKPKKKAAVKS